MRAAVTKVERDAQTEEMISLLQRHEIQVLLRAGLEQADIASRVGVSLRTVRRVLSEAAVTHVDDPAEHRARGLGRPSKAGPFAEKVRAWLAEEGGDDLPTQELLRRAKEHGYSGNKTAFYALVAGVRPPRASAAGAWSSQRPPPARLGSRRDSDGPPLRFTGPDVKECVRHDP